MITAIVLDGFHRGHTVRMDYMPTLKLLKPRVHRMDYCCRGGKEVYLEEDEIIVYNVCFQAIDRKMALYSLKGESQDLMLGNLFGHVFSEKPWSRKTDLYMGFHEEPIIREDSTPNQ